MYTKVEKLTLHEDSMLRRKGRYANISEAYRLVSEDGKKHSLGCFVTEEAASEMLRILKEKENG